MSAHAQPDDETPTQMAHRHLAEAIADFCATKAKARRIALTGAALAGDSREYLTAYANAAEKAAEAYRKKAEGERG